MTVTTYDNAPPLDGWHPEPRCCGALCGTIACPTCGEYVKPGPHLILGEN